MTTTFTNYTTIPGQRWDSIAYAVFNDPYAYQTLIENNPTYGNVLQFAQAVTLQIPVIEETTTVTPDLLPPWRR